MPTHYHTVNNEPLSWFHCAACGASGMAQASGDLSILWPFLMPHLPDCPYHVPETDVVWKGRKPIMTDENISLADLAGLDLSNVQAVRFLKFPKGNFVWQVVDPKLDTVGDGKSAAIIPLECKKVLALFDENEKEENWLGKKHTHIQQLKNQDDLGRLVALFVDAGYNSKGTIQELLAGFNGHMFVAPIRVSKNKDDPDNPYHNLDTSKIKTLEALTG